MLSIDPINSAQNLRITQWSTNVRKQTRIFVSYSDTKCIVNKIRTLRNIVKTPHGSIYTQVMSADGVSPNFERCLADQPGEDDVQQKLLEAHLHQNWLHIVLTRSLALAVLVGIIAVGTSLLKSGISLPDAHTPPTLVPPDTEEWQPPSWSKLKVFRKGAICVDAEPCALIGRSMLQRNGSAVDAALATMICNGLINMQSMGFGGGFLMTVYDRANRQAVTLDARESAPRAARSDIFDDLPVLASQTGPLAITVPGELDGYWKAHQRFGKVPWSELFKPSISICESGYIMTKAQHDGLLINSEAIKKDPTLRSWFVDSKTGKFLVPGSLIRPSQLCKTMRLVAIGNATEFYNGSLSRILIQDLRIRGSILTVEDLTLYRAKWASPISTKLSTGETLHTVGPPGGGAILAFLLNVLDGYRFGPSSLSTQNVTLTTYHKIIEAFKFGFALRTKLADPAYVDLKNLLGNLTSRSYAEEIRTRISDRETWNDPRRYGEFAPQAKNDQGTSHVSILAPNGDAVSATSSINMYFGSGVASERTGILMSSTMNDFGVINRENYFGLPASPNNLVEPGKRPLSSMSPSILVDQEGDVRMVIGAAGGTKIITSIAFVIARHLWMKETIKEAVDAARIHHQLRPMDVSYEYGVPKRVIDGLISMGHKTSRYRDRGSVVCAIVRLNGTIYANVDYRKGGDVLSLD
ncbi:glutathione hydrolase 1 proenzyme [Athalia rosae]|uniref:glutathione hydrolase 1 proenzyme n=1 Tax=Athalia rosae TaxID=37344 RepID=UPI0020340B70|nr:glutathione hydrolase 1 proenzyme [Athalia rosae]